MILKESITVNYLENAWKSCTCSSFYLIPALAPFLYHGHPWYRKIWRNVAMWWPCIAYWMAEKDSCSPNQSVGIKAALNWVALSCQAMSILITYVSADLLASWKQCEKEISLSWLAFQSPPLTFIYHWNVNKNPRVHFMQYMLNWSMMQSWLATGTALTLLLC